MNRMFLIAAAVVALCLMLFVSWQSIKLSHNQESVPPATSEPIGSPVESGDSGTGEVLPEAPPVENTPVACTMDAKQCPDGSYVGRVGPDCEFAVCPVASSLPISCPVSAREPGACVTEYDPVCGLVQVECITTPCNPVPETFSNSCEACMNSRVILYTKGACEETY